MTNSFHWKLQRRLLLVLGSPFIQNPTIFLSHSALKVVSNKKRFRVVHCGPFPMDEGNDCIILLIFVALTTNYTLFCIMFWWLVHSLWFVNCAVSRTTGNTTILSNNELVGSVAKRTLSEQEVWGSTPILIKSAQCRQRLATAAMFLWSCAAQAPSRRDGPRHLLHASA